MYRNGKKFFFATAASCLLALTGAPAQAQDAEFGLSPSAVQQAPPSPVLKFVEFKDNYLRVEWLNVKNGQNLRYQVYRFENYDPQNTLRMIATFDYVKAEPSRDGSLLYYRDYKVEPLHGYTYFMTVKDAFGNQSANSRMVAGKAPDATSFKKR